MGQSRSSMLPHMSRRRSGADPVVVVDKSEGRGALPISCRYTASRSLSSDYTLEPKVVGSGMSGPVRLATGRGDNRKYAVKSFRKIGMSSKSREELKSEAEIYLSLDHPHVARLEMVYETDEELHLVMEYMAGGELYDRLFARKRYSEEEAAEAAHQMLLAVAYLHAHKIAHRDLKLENFMYEKKDANHLKIIDFGFAKFTRNNKKMSQALGSIHYVAPEVLAHSYTEKADLWSLGVIVYMLLTGSPPIFGSDDQVLKKIKTGDVHWSSRFRRLSDPARDFLASLLVVDPVKRLSAQAALSHPWVKERHHIESSLLDARSLESLRSFGKMSQFRRNVMYTMAWSLSSEDRIELRKQFLSIDKDKGGTISLKEFKDVLTHRFNVGSSEAEELFKSLDADNNDEIEYCEFLAALLPSKIQAHEGALRKAFSRFDCDGDGTIDSNELRRALGDTFSTDEIEDLLREADTSGDGKLNYEEFLAYFRKMDPAKDLTEVEEELESPGETPPECPMRRRDLVHSSTSGPGLAKADPAPKKQGTPWLARQTSDGGRSSLPTLLDNFRMPFRSKV